jgi:hypothetical protein
MQHKKTKKNIPNLETRKWIVLKIERDIIILDENSSKFCPFIVTILWNHLGIKF